MSVFPYCEWVFSLFFIAPILWFPVFSLGTCVSRVHEWYQGYIFSKRYPQYMEWTLDLIGQIIVLYWTDCWIVTRLLQRGLAIAEVGYNLFFFKFARKHDNRVFCDYPSVPLDQKNGDNIMMVLFGSASERSQTRDHNSQSDCAPNCVVWFSCLKNHKIDFSSKLKFEVTINEGSFCS